VLAWRVPGEEDAAGLVSAGGAPGVMGWLPGLRAVCV
jgi:hypothetical protein